MRQTNTRLIIFILIAGLLIQNEAKGTIPGDLLESGTFDCIHYLPAPVQPSPPATSMLNGPCPDIFQPVCGSDGVTYINSCFAEQAGIYDYTPGICYSDCIDPAIMNPDADCNDEFEPVCGCNGVTYLNECVAEAEGVTTYYSGSCNDDCYDPLLILNSPGVSIDMVNGTLSLNCGDEYDPVCGCDGITYTNACYAGAAGVSLYTSGECGNGCVDPEQIQSDPFCNFDYDPVCGCNQVTYINSCSAAAAGVLSYVDGVCGDNAPWCMEATPVSCGDFLASETTVGAGNQLVQYPGCAGNFTFNGPDKVYAINKTASGDLQIGLEIITPDLDLDMFLLASDCGNVTCLAASLTSNNLTNNEGIVLEDASPGLYYLVVDGQFADAQGEYRLEVSCGYLDCSDAQALNCGEPFSYNNFFGTDDVSLYGCDGNILNVENNGPEVVHTFTITEPDSVEISLTGLFANLELFLLRSCDRGDCVDFSQNPGVNDESITAFLEAGTYYLVVDGYNGAVSNYTLLVDCSAPCDLSLDTLASSLTPCGENNGALTLVTSGGSSDFIVYYEGPVSGSLVTDADSNTISGLPTGIYSVRKVDALGCEVNGTATINSDSDLEVSITVTDASCGDTFGQVEAVIFSGFPTYFVQVTGPVSVSLTNFTPVFEIDGLPPGDYTIFLQDGTGCTASQEFTINYDNNGFAFTTMTTAADCQNPGSISVTGLINGQSPLHYSFTGPISGSGASLEGTFNIGGLPGGAYLLTLLDANGCSATQTVLIEEQNVFADITLNENTCGQDGSITVNISSGTAPFNIIWDGPVSGSDTTSNNNYLIDSLENGSYSIIVSDANNCTDSEVGFLDNGVNDLEIVADAFSGLCDDPGSIFVDISGGTANYVIAWEGPAFGIDTLTTSTYTIPNLPSGSYVIKVSDFFGCSDTQQNLTISNQPDDLEMDYAMTPGICGMPGSFELQITGGSLPYSVNWNGPVSGSADVSSAGYVIDNLPAGDYNISILDPNGCSDFFTAGLIVEPNDLTIAPVPADGLCGNPAQIQVNISGGTPGYTLNWNGPVSGSALVNGNSYVIDNLPEGAYDLSTEDPNGCSDDQTIYVAIAPNDLSITPTITEGLCGNPGTIGLSISGGTPPYILSWSGPVSGNQTVNGNSFTIDGLPSGAYTIIVTDPNGCIDDQPVTINNMPDNLTIGASVTDGICGEAGAISIDISGGTPPYSIFWTGPSSGGSGALGNSFTITDLESGVYNISATDPNGCEDQQTVTVTNTPDDLTMTATASSGLCGNTGTISLDISGGTPPYHIDWTGPESGSTQSGDGIFLISGLNSGDYTIEVTDPNGCGDTQFLTLANEPDDLSFTAVPQNGLCGQTGSIGLIFSGGTPPYSISWDGPASGSFTTNASAFVLSDLPAGSYDISITDPNGCSDSQTASLSIAPDDLTISTTPVNGICGQGGSINVFFSGGEPPFSLNWTGPVNGSAVVNGGSFTIENLSQGTYTLTVSDPNDCSDEQITSVLVAPNDLAFAASVVPGICGSPGTISLNISGGSPDYTISWSGPVSGSATIFGTIYNIPGLTSGSYLVNISDPNGCNQSQLIAVNNNPDDLSLSANAVDGLCNQAGSIELSISGGTPDYTVSWSGPSSGSTTISGNAFTISDLDSGTYDVSITDPNACSDMVSVSVSLFADNLSFSAVPEDGLCGQQGSIAVNISGGTPDYSISWDGPASGSATTTGSSYNIDELPAGSYSITVTDPNGCSNSSSAEINNLPDDLLIDLSPEDAICQTFGQIVVQIDGGTPPYNISWQGPASGSAVVSTGIYTIPNLPAGQYTVGVTDPNTCADNQAVTVSITPDNMTMDIVPENGICGQPAALLVNFAGGEPPYLLNWDGPVSGAANVNANSFNLNNLPGGNYTLSVSDANGCNDQQETAVSIAPDDLNFLASVENGICGQLGTIALNISGGSPDYLIEWNGPASGSATVNDNSYNISGLPSGNYTISISDPNGCGDNQVLPVSNSPDDLSLSATPVDGFCDQPGSILLSITGGTPDYTISWSGPTSGSTNTQQPGYSITGLPGGTYTVSINDPNGCSDILIADVAVFADDLSFTADPINGICGQAGSIQLAIDGGMPEYLISWSGPVNGSAMTGNNSYTIEGLEAGTYNLSVSDPNGCSDMGTTQLTIEPNDLILALNPINGACGAQGQIQGQISGGMPDYAVSWTGPSSGVLSASAGTFTVPDLPGGDYTFTVIDPQGCENQAQTSLNNTPDDLVFATTILPGVCGQTGAIQIDISGGTPDYTINWAGAASGSATVSGESYTISGLQNGTYFITITDPQGCTDNQITGLVNTPDDLSLNLNPIDLLCGQPGSIGIGIAGGSPPYSISWTGPESGAATINDNNFLLDTLPSGIYQISISDPNGCSDVQTTEIVEAPDNLSANPVAVNGTCGTPGAIELNISGGVPDYDIFWDGPVSGSATLDSNSLTISGLETGTYFISVVDPNGCSDLDTLTIDNNANDLSIAAAPVDGLCGLPGVIDLSFTNGDPLFTINWEGPDSGSDTTSAGIYSIAGLEGGEYDITVTDPNGCSDSLQAVPVAVAPNDLKLTLDPENGLCGTLGSISISLTGGNPDYTLTWTGPGSGSATFSESNYTISGLESGAYEVAIQDPNGCGDAETVVIDNGAELAFQLSETDATCTEAGTIQVDILSGTPGFTIAWDGPVSGTGSSSDTSFEIENLTAGNYSVTITDLDGCESEAAASIILQDELELFLTVSDGLCSNPGSIEVEVNGGAPGYSINWTGPDSGSDNFNNTFYSIPNLQSGNYDITVTDAGGCEEQQSVVINTTGSTLGLQTGILNGSCGELGVILLEINGGDPAFSISWSGPSAGSATTSQLQFAIPDLESGDYTVIVNDTNGCSDTTDLTVNNIPDDLTAAVAPVDGVCGQFGSIDVVIEGGAPNYFINWEGPFSGFASTSEDNYSISGLAGGNYALTISDANGCVEMQTTTVSIAPNTLSMAVTPNSGFCGALGSIEVGVVGGAPGYTVAWSGPVNGSFELPGTLLTLEDLPSGNYSLTVTDDNGCQYQENTTVTNFPSFLDYSVLPQNGVCEQGAFIEVTITGGLAPFSISWQGPVAGSATFEESLYNIADLPTGFYMLTITDDQDCSETDEAFVNNLDGDVILLASPSEGLCGQPGSINVEIMEGTGPYTISWSGPASGTATTNNSSFTIPDLETGDYLIGVSDDNGCSDSQPVSLSNNAGSVELVTEPQNGLCDQPGSAVLTIDGGAAPFTINWDGVVSGSNTVSDPFYTIPDLSAGAYSVVVTDSNGCSDSQDFVIDSEPGNIIMDITPENGLCESTGSVSVTITGDSPVYLFSWIGPVSGSVFVEDSAFLGELPDGTYTISVLDGNGCTAEEVVSISNIPNDLEATVTALDGTCDQPGTVEVGISGGTSPFTISWDGPEAGTANTTDGIFAISQLTSGLYTISITDSNGCGTTGSATVNNLGDDLALGIMPNNGGCAGNGSISLSISGGSAPYSVEWFGAASGSAVVDGDSYTINNLGSGAYTIILADANGCSDSGNASLDNTSNPLTLSLETGSGLCEEDGVITVNMNGGTPPYNVGWNGPVFGSATSNEPQYVIEDLVSGNYTVVIFDEGGCVKSQSIEVTPGEGAVAADINGQDGSCVEAARITVKVLSGIPGYTIEWEGPSAGSASTDMEDYIIQGLTEGVYQVLITDSNGCSYTESIEVFVPQNDINMALEAQSSICESPGAILLTVDGGSPLYEISWNGIGGSGTDTTSADTYAISGLEAGFYSVSVTDVNECMTTGLAQINNETSGLELTASTLAATCEGEGQIDLNIAGGTPGYEVVWEGPSPGNDSVGGGLLTIFGLDNGSYSITVTDASGCTSSEDVSIELEGGAPSASFSFEEDVLTINFDNLSSSGDYSWDFGDGFTSTEFAPQHEYCDPGIYEVCLNVSNDCGTEEFCTELIINIPTDLVILEVEDANASAGASVSIPVTVDQCDLIVSLAGSFEIENPAVATITGISPGKISPQFNPGNNSFNFFDNNGVGIALQPEDILFYLEVEVTGAPGDSTFIRIVDSPLQIEVGSIIDGNPTVLPHIALKGKLVIGHTNQISGAVTTFWGEGIENAIIGIDNTHYNDTERTDEAGNYLISDIPFGDPYIVQAFKDTLPENGLSTYALFVGQRFILGLSPVEIVSPYQIIAGDANCNDAFTTLDLFIIQQIIIGVSTSFADCPSWVFVHEGFPMPDDFDAYNVFPYANADTLTLVQDTVVNFIGVKVGDILGHADPNLLQEEEIEERNQGALYLHTDNQSIEQGETLTLEFRSSNFSDIVSYQLALAFDAGKLEFDEFLSPENNALASVAAGSGQEGKLRISWFDLNGAGVSAGTSEAVFRIRFTALEDISELSQLIRIAPSSLRAEAHKASGEALELVLIFEETLTRSTRNKKSDYQLYQNIPNPFEDRTLIGFEMPEAIETEFIIHDHLGREVIHIRKIFGSGYNKITLTKGQLQPGLYYYTLRTADFTDTRSMVLLH